MASSLGDLRAVARDVGFGLAQRFFVGARVDLKEQVALGDVLAFGERRLISWPAICDLTCTMADASTVPTTRSSVGTDSWVALDDGNRDDGRTPPAPWPAAPAYSRKRTTGTDSGQHGRGGYD